MSPPIPEPIERVSELQLLIVSTLFCLGALTFDLLTSAEVAAGVVYVALVLLGASSRAHHHALCAAGVGTLFTIVGYVGSPVTHDGEGWSAISNRALAIFAIWTTAMVVESFRRNRRRLDLANARLREQEALARLGEMAAVVAHEVKNPLAGIRGSLQVIENRMDESSAERKIMHTIRNRIDALHGSLDDMLVFARPRAPERQPIPVKALVQGVVDQLREDPEARDIEFEIEAETEAFLVDADAPMCREALLNLVLNAAQAMDWQGQVRITTRIADNMGCIAIHDQGPGIPDSLRDKIFQPFFTTKTRGTGLGLAIVKRMVDAHGGLLSFDSPPTGGTVVQLRLPLA